MTDVALRIAAGAAIGVVLGAVVFGGLKLTVDRLATSTRPLLLAGASLLLRMGALVGGLVGAARAGGLAAVLAATAAILATRQVVVTAARRGAEETAT